MRLLFDAEANNLLEEATNVWCIVAKDLDNGKMYYFTPNDLDLGLIFLSQAKVLVGHNIIGYDLPLFEKLHNFKYDGAIVDTLIWSRLFNPDRVNPRGYNGRAPHSVEAWGTLFGHKKPEHEDWSKYSKEMLFRCEQDVLITEKIYHHLLKEKEE